jgi:hypothetical protein
MCVCKKQLILTDCKNCNFLHVIATIVYMLLQQISVCVCKKNTVWFSCSRTKKGVMRCMFAKRLCVWLQFLLTCGSNMIVKNIEKRRHIGCWLGDIRNLPPATLGSLLGSCSICKKLVHASDALLMSWRHKITWPCCILRSLPCVLLCTFSASVKLLQDS